MSILDQLESIGLDKQQVHIYDIPEVSPPSNRYSWNEKNWQISYAYGSIVFGKSSKFYSAYISENISKKLWSLREIQRLPGEWLIVAKHKLTNDYIAMTDPYGMECIFYSIIPFHKGNRIIFGKNFRGIQETLYRYNIKSEINLPSAVLTLGTNSLYHRSRNSSQTFSNNIKVLNVGEYLLLSKNGYKIDKTPNDSNISNLSYEQLIQKGIENASSQLQLLAGTENPTTLALSGGKDSRLLLALADHAGILQDISIYTVDPRSMPQSQTRDVNMEDFNAAIKLAQYFKLRWRHTPSFDSYQLTTKESVNLWQELRSNNSFEYRRINSIDIPEIESNVIMGCGGELYRGYMGPGTIKSSPMWWNKAGKTYDSIAEDIKLLYEQVIDDSLFPNTLKEEIKQHFIYSMIDDFDSKDVKEALERNFINFRNRAHFGAPSITKINGTNRYYPLLDPYFVEAARRLPPEDAEEGKVIFDILKLASPVTLTLPFAGSQLPQRFSDGFNFPAMTWDNLDTSKTLSDLEQAHSKNRLARTLKKPVPAENHDGILTDHINTSVDKFLDYLSSFIPSNEVNLFAQQMAVTCSQSWSTSMAFAGKIESVIDVIEGSQTKLEHIHLDSQKPNNIQQRNLALLENYNFTKIRNEIGFGEVDPHLVALNDGSYAVNISHIPAGAKVAVYWFFDGTRVKTCWYENTKSITLDRTEVASTGEIRAQVFFKWDHLKHASKVVDLGIN